MPEKTMKWLVLLIITVILIGCASGISFREFPYSEFTTRFEPSALMEDIDFLFETMEQVHPNIYAYVSKDTISQLRQELAARLNSPMTRIEFWKEVAPIVATLRDGHTSLPFPREERVQLVDSAGLIFPFDVSISEGRLYIVANYSSDSTIAPGSELLSVNGKSSQEIYATFLQYAHGERTPFRERTVAYLFPRLFWFLYNIETGYHLKARSPTGGLISCSVNGITGEALRKKRDQLSASQTAVPYTYRVLPEANAVVIDFVAFRDLNKFENFLREIFQTIQDQRIHNLIIDIRRNGGGDSQLGDALLNYITDSPYAQWSRVELKKSKQIEAYLKQGAPWYVRWVPYWLARLLHGEARRFVDTPYGGIVVTELQPKKPEENLLRFGGPVYLLTGPSTFSSATAFAATIKDLRIGTIIGEETGGLATSYGDIYYFQLPRTKLIAGVSFKRFVRPSGEEDGRGVLPDHEVIVRPEEWRSGKDPAVEFTLNLISAQAR